uniref:Uncharacterized protein n=1 Tax=Octopus bimaculoides TaxID=37653 RepID=A0A0L8GCW6_OCTBM
MQCALSMIHVIYKGIQQLSGVCITSKNLNHQSKGSGMMTQL